MFVKEIPKVRTPWYYVGLDRFKNLNDNLEDPIKNSPPFSTSKKSMVTPSIPWKQFAPLTLLNAEHVSMTYTELCALPQLGGDFFDPSNRPSGFPSLPLKCPLVPTSALNAISKRTRDLTVADTEIRNNVADSCQGSLSCSCGDCASVRNEFLTALRNLSSIASPPPHPTTSVPLPPSTRPPRFKAATAPLAIPEVIREDAPANLPPIAPFLAVDLPLTNASGVVFCALESDTPSEAVAHISWGRCSTAVSAPDSEWIVPDDARSHNWLAGDTNLVAPPSPEGALVISSNATVFDIASHSSRVSSASWVIEE